ncbi:3-deoxy-7-phosphoheptulonate synthase [Nocardia sp. NPDC051052]|uniref:3-deoxy-7-phosphoheptulonate synthase n=1 Tax=Nocardia sp. NPDC051052 TaxID=3364322 RepID=UPI0037890EF6
MKNILRPGMMTVADIRLEHALQQPDWANVSEIQHVRAELAARPALVNAVDVYNLRNLLASVAVGSAYIIQAGDCAEDPSERTAADIARKVGLLEVLAGTMKMNTRKPILRVGRIAGQFAKPRSTAYERVGGLDLPVYRGHMVNAPEATPEHRRPDPFRMVSCYEAAAEIMHHLSWRGRTRRSWTDSPVWTSHEALLLDYEIPFLREDASGQLLLGSTHWPWIGERTRGVDGAHVAMLADVANPVACKIGPGMDSDELLALCERLDPEREPGRLTLVARMGADLVAERLPDLVTTLRAAGHPVIWLCDPMHGNTVTVPGHGKIRYLDAIVRETQLFQQAVRGAGGIAGGLHLETTPEGVAECVENELSLDCAGGKYTSLCDPRLNPDQAVAVVSQWRG